MASPQISECMNCSGLADVLVELVNRSFLDLEQRHDSQCDIAAEPLICSCWLRITLLKTTEEG